MLQKPCLNALSAKNLTRLLMCLTYWHNCISLHEQTITDDRLQLFENENRAKIGRINFLIIIIKDFLSSFSSCFKLTVICNLSSPLGWNRPVNVYAFAFMLIRLYVLKSCLIVQKKVRKNISKYLTTRLARLYLCTINMKTQK